MAVKNYLINDKWLDIDKQNIVEVKSTDGVIESVKVNSEEYGGGGSGGSDFSTAEVVLTNNSGNPFDAHGATFYNEEESKYSTGSVYESSVSATIPLILYKGMTYLELETSINKSAVVLSGDITGVNDILMTTKYKGFYITGNGTITITGGA